MEKCNKDKECKGYMTRMDDYEPNTYCGIVIQAACDSLSNVSLNVECVPRKPANIGELLPNSTCAADQYDWWSGCYIKYGRCTIHMQPFQFVIILLVIKTSHVIIFMNVFHQNLLQILAKT